MLQLLHTLLVMRVAREPERHQGSGIDQDPPAAYRPKLRKRWRFVDMSVADCWILPMIPAFRAKS